MPGYTVHHHVYYIVHIDFDLLSPELQDPLETPLTRYQPTVLQVQSILIFFIICAFFCGHYFLVKTCFVMSFMIKENNGLTYMRQFSSRLYLIEELFLDETFLTILFSEPPLSSYSNTVSSPPRYKFI